MQNKPPKRSATPEHMLAGDPGLELRQLGRVGGPAVSSSAVRGIAVSSPRRQSLQSQYQPTVPSPAPLYSQANRGLPPPSTTYNPGYQEQRRYLSEGELLGEGGAHLGGQGVGSSSSAGHIQVGSGWQWSWGIIL